MQNISGFNTLGWLIASNTFPIGFPVTQWSDDVDPIDIPVLQIGDGAMGLNGDLITWSKANPVRMTISQIPGSVTDNLLSILLNANRPSRGKIAANDIITFNFVLPDGTPVGLSPGTIISGMPGRSIASEGRQKTKTYEFMFEAID
jgi:hypothetical protein